MSKRMSFSDKAKKYLLRSRLIDPKTNCWLFTGRTSYQKGYGRIEINGKRYFVNRLALSVWSKFDINSPLYALHKKECPNTNCFNPEHLYAGTPQDNINDAKELGHLSNGLCKRGHKLSYYRSKDRITGKRRLKGYCKICQASRG